MQRPAEQCYAAVVEALRDGPGVIQGSGGEGFGASALKAGGKIFAMLSSRNARTFK